MLQLRSENLLKVYKGRAVVNDVSVQVSQGEIVGLLGPNGAGKTTSFYQIVGLIPPDSGKIFLGDREITDQPMYMRAQLGIGYLPQEASVFRHLSVEDNIAAVLEMTTLNKEQQKTRLENLLSEFGLNRVRRSMGNVLSGGERRRTEIARALATDPKFILLDEPFAGIDPIAVEDIQRIVIKLKQKNIGVLITDHNVQETLSITDRAYLLFEGKILKAGTAEELAEDEQVRKVYLGQNFVLHRKDVMLSHGVHEHELNIDTVMKYTADLLRMTDDITEKLKHGTPYHSINDFARSLTDYSLLVGEFARKENLTPVLQRLSGLSIKSAGSDWKITALELSGGLLQNLLGAEKWMDYFTEVKNELQKMQNELGQLLASSTK
ncbi:MAG: LPS export ABC transporter ATP-binding protein [Chitinophagales bacterium]|nr:LPS export ABC transporter ATP-binding protein [Chitinophagales bacterium]